MKHHDAARRRSGDRAAGRAGVAAALERAQDGGMFLFFSSRAGCLTSLVISAAVTALLWLLLAR